MMLYQFSPEQDELRDVVRKLLGGVAAARRSYDEGAAAPDPALWSELTGLGLAGLGVPETDGGSGGDLVDQIVVAEELGRAVAPVPFVAHAVATEAVRLAAPAPHRSPWLAGLVSGAVIGAVALDRPALSYSDGRVSGELASLFDGAGATLLIALSDQGVAAVPDVAPRALPTVDRTRPVSTVTLDAAPAVLLDDGGAGPALADHLRRRQLTLYATEAAGVAAEALERTAAYTVEREQFGRPIGTFQAVKHRLADMLVEVESARSAAYAAAWANTTAPGADPRAQADAGAQAGGTEGDVAVALAQAVATEAAVRVVGGAIQLHGGIGVTWEHDLHLLLRRAKALELFGGPPAEHYARIATALLGPAG